MSEIPLPVIATTADLAQLGVMHFACLQETSKNPHTYDKRILQIQVGKFFESPVNVYNLHAWVIKTPSAYLGACVTSVLNIPPSEQFSRGLFMHLDSIYVHPPFRKRGLAALLLETMFAAAKGLFCDAVFVSSPEASRPLFEKYGFVAEYGYMRRDVDAGNLSPMHVGRR